MLFQIKSIKILKDIFSFLTKKVELKLIFSNKKLSRKLNITSNDYKLESVYIINNEDNDIVKLINPKNNFIFYKGGFANGKANGYGEEYELILYKESNNLTENNINKKELYIYNNNISELSKKLNEVDYFGNFVYNEYKPKGKTIINGVDYQYDTILIYEGNYKNWKRNGKGKEYDIERNIIFEGEYLNGLRWNGKGKEYGKENNLIFEGEYLNGLRWKGKGKEYDIDDYLIYEGEYLNGERNGKGKEYCGGNLSFEGEFKNGLICNGTMITYNPRMGYKDIVELKNGIRNGYRKTYDNNKLIFDGKYKDGKKHGYCIKKDIDGKILFEGEYLEGIKWNGIAKKYESSIFEDGINEVLIFEGEIKNGIAIGKKYDNKGNLIYEGELNYKNLKENGRGKKYDINNCIISEGYFLNGIIKDKDDLEFDKNFGYFKGEEKDDNGNLLFEGEYLKGTRWNGKRNIYDIKGNFLFEIKYNCGYQTIINEKIYKEINSKNKDENGKELITGKEIDFQINTIFEGEFLNEKKWNGIIRKYDSLKIEAKKYIIFEGQLLNGDVNGKGKEYNSEGKIIFEGEYLNGKRNGKGKKITFLRGTEFIFDSVFKDIQGYNTIIFDNKDNKYYIFEGEYKDGKKHGQGKIFFQNMNIKFEGIYRNGARLKGKEYDEKGNLIFEGEYTNGKYMNGKYKLFNDEGKIIKEIEYLEGKMKIIKKYDSNGNFLFEGENMIYEMHDGKGREYDEQGNIIYEGTYNLKNREIGKGKQYDYEGKVYEQEYFMEKIWNGKFRDKKVEFDKTYISEYEYKNGSIKTTYQKIYDKNENLIGENNYIDGKRNGKGVEFDLNGNKIFEGEYKNDIKNGNGKEYSNGKIIFEGEYLNGKRNGKGIAFNYDGKKIFKGEYKNEKKWNGKEYYYDRNKKFITEYIDGIKSEKIIMKEYLKKMKIFEGECKNEKRHGKGREYNFKGQLTFEGEYLNNKKHGKGKEYNSKGKIIFEGEYLNNRKWNGFGYNEKGLIDYNICNGNGTIKEYNNDKLIYDGEYLNGYKHGWGKEYHSISGKLIYEGKFLYDKKLK